jgi:hypothetical protein
VISSVGGKREVAGVALPKGETADFITKIKTKKFTFIQKDNPK